MLAGEGSGQIAGRMGDKSQGIARPEILDASVGRWREVLGNPVRRWFAARYLRELGPDVCATFGVDMHATLRELRNLPSSAGGSFVDAVALTASFAAPRVAANLVRDLWRAPERPLVKLD